MPAVSAGRGSVSDQESTGQAAVPPSGRRHVAGRLLLDVSQTASLLGLSEKAIRNRVDRRLLPFRRLGGRVVFVRAELDAFVAALEGCGVDEAIANIRLRRGQT